MTAERPRNFARVALVAAGCPLLAFSGTTISGGLDARALHYSSPQDTRVKLHGLFLNLRQVWSDATGDRWIGIAQADFDNNLQDIRPYQVYLQYKGPLGKWNVRAGHYLLPFGLLATYDTERLVLQGIEDTSLGIRKDTGAQFLGHSGDWDYAVSVTGGAGDIRLADSRADPVLTARLAYVKDDWQAGFSTLIGRPWARFEPLIGEEGTSARFTRQRRVALDLVMNWERLTVRAEAGGGTDNGRGVWGGVVFADYALLRKLELNSRYAVWHRDTSVQEVGVGLTHNAGRGWFFRLAGHRELGERGRKLIVAQVYYEFRRHL
jgi:hypothetical protein